MIELKDIARNKWRSLLPALGVSADFLTGRQGPCPVCGGKDRFRFDDKDGRGTWFCNACRAGDGISLLQRKHGWSFMEASERIRPLLGEAVETVSRHRSSFDPMAACRALWSRSVALREGDLVSRYLVSRGHQGPYAPDLRFLADCPVTHVEGRRSLPAMLAMVRAPEGDGASIHRTYLDGPAKAAIDSPRRMMPGSVVRGSAIRLMPAAETLGVAEGIETALAVYRDHGIPCWAAANAQMLREFAWPMSVRHLIVFGDNDRKFGGHAAAYQLAHRAMTAPKPIEAEVRIPPRTGDDWEDHGNRQIAHAA